MASTSIKNGKAHVLEISNRATVQKLSNESLSGLTDRLDNHESGLNGNAHGIINIAGLANELNTINDNIVSLDESLQFLDENKLNKPAIQYSGTLTVITGINFTIPSYTQKVLTFEDGILTSVV